jgi:hypothetical protein
MTQRYSSEALGTRRRAPFCESESHPPEIPNRRTAAALLAHNGGMELSWAADLDRVDRDSFLVDLSAAVQLAHLTGSMEFIEECVSEWRDTAVKLADVALQEHLFERPPTES